MKNSLTFQYTLSTPKDLPRALTHITTTLERLAEERRWSTETTHRVNLILEELISNTTEHGGPASVTINLKHSRKGLHITFSDDAPPFDTVREAPPPNLPSPHHALVPGGLGLELVRSMSSTMDYTRSSGRNVTSLLLVPDPHP